MKKISYFTLAIVFSVLIACKGKKAEDKENMDNKDTVTVSVAPGASNEMTEAQKTDSILNQSSEDELFGTDLDDKEVDKATKK